MATETIKISDAKYYYIYRVIKYIKKYMILINMPKNKTVQNIVYILQSIMIESNELKDKSFYKYEFNCISLKNNFGPYSIDLENDINVAYNNSKFDLELSPLIENHLHFLEKEILGDKSCTHDVVAIIARILSTTNHCYDDHLKTQYSGFMVIGNYKCDYNDIYTAITKIAHLKEQYNIFLKAYEYSNKYILSSLEYRLNYDIRVMNDLLSEISIYKSKEVDVYD